MGGLRNICKAYGGMVINGVKWVWDHEKDEPVLESEMTKERQQASERARKRDLLKATKEEASNERD